MTERLSPSSWVGTTALVLGVMGLMGDDPTLRVGLLGLSLGLGVSSWALYSQEKLRRELARLLSTSAENGPERPLPSRDPVVQLLARHLEQQQQELTREKDELARDQRRLTALMDSTSDGVLLTGPDGRIRAVNRALREIFLLRREVVGRTPLEALHSSELGDAISSALKQGRDSRVELRVEGLKPRALQAHILALPEGRNTEVLALLHDQTRLRRLEQVRRDFVANVSHELRTPITAIRGCAEALEDGAIHDPEQAGRFLEIMVRHCERLGALLADILDLARIESHELVLRPERLILEEVSRSVLALFETPVQARALQVEVQCPPELTVLVDRRALEHILSNLVDNAVKYSSPGGRLWLKAGVETDHTWLEVADSGPGIPARHLPRIFERFYRVDTGRSREVGGTGLGLSIVKHLVDAIGAEIEVHSEVGRGTHFRLTFDNNR